VVHISNANSHTLQIPEVLIGLRVLMATETELNAVSPELTKALEEDKVCTLTRCYHHTVTYAIIVEHCSR
jgi:hypothetical protein